MSGGKLQKYRLNVKTNKILGATHNQLVDGELRDRQRPAPPPDPRAFAPKNPIAIEIVWEEAEALPIGAVVALVEPLYFPADRPQTPFEGLRFRCRLATTEDVASGHFAVTSEPIAAAVGDRLAIGHGWLPAAVWAQVDVSSTDHKFAEPAEDEFIAVSGDAGRFPIVWKPAAADGICWCVVLLAAMGTGPAGDTIRRILLTTDVGAVAFGTDEDDFLTVTPGTGEGFLFSDLTPPVYGTGGTPLKWTVTGDLVPVLNYNHFKIRTTSGPPEAPIYQGPVVVFGRPVSYTVGEGETAYTETAYEIFAYDITAGQTITGEGVLPEAAYHPVSERNLLWGNGECG
jgi:hypothetical protein